MRLIFVSSLRIVGEKQVRRPGDVRDPFVHGAILQPVYLVSDNRERNYSPALDCNYLSQSLVGLAKKILKVFILRSKL